jgi:hypothetical protein
VTISGIRLGSTSIRARSSEGASRNDFVQALSSFLCGPCFFGSSFGKREINSSTLKLRHNPSCEGIPWMPDLRPSIRRLLPPARFSTSIRFHRRIPPAAGNPIKFAHLSRDLSSNLESHGGPFSMMNPVGNLSIEATAMVAS